MKVTGGGRERWVVVEEADRGAASPIIELGVRVKPRLLSFCLHSHSNLGRLECPSPELQVIEQAKRMQTRATGWIP